MIGFELLGNLLRLAAEYLRHQTETDLDDRIDKSRKSLYSMQVRIDRYRDAGTSAATQRADQLQSDYEVEAKHLEYLYSRRSEFTGRSEGSDA